TRSKNNSRKLSGSVGGRPSSRSTSWVSRYLTKSLRYRISRAHQLVGLPWKKASPLQQPITPQCTGGKAARFSAASRNSRNRIRRPRDFMGGIIPPAVTIEPGKTCAFKVYLCCQASRDVRPARHGLAACSYLVSDPALLLGLQIRRWVIPRPA